MRAGEAERIPYLGEPHPFDEAFSKIIYAYLLHSANPFLDSDQDQRSAICTLLRSWISPAQHTSSVSVHERPGYDDHKVHHHPQTKNHKGEHHSRYAEAAQQESEKDDKQHDTPGLDLPDIESVDAQPAKKKAQNQRCQAKFRGRLGVVLAMTRRSFIAFDLPSRLNWPDTSLLPLPPARGTPVLPSPEIWRQTRYILGIRPSVMLNTSHRPVPSKPVQLPCLHSV